MSPPVQRRQLVHPLAVSSVRDPIRDPCHVLRPVVLVGSVPCHCVTADSDVPTAICDRGIPHPGDTAPGRREDGATAV